MRVLLVFLLLFNTSVAQNEAGDDLNNLIDQFFGEGQAPVTEEVLDLEIEELIDSDDVRQSIRLEETILDSFAQEVEEREEKLWQLSNEKSTIEDQLSLLDQQIGLDQERVATYRVQEAKWQAVLTKVTEQKSLLDAALRAEKTEYQNLLSQAYIRAQNLGSDDKVSWWEWLFSSRSVSQIIEQRAERKKLLDQKKNSLKTLEQLKQELEARERQAALVYSRVTELSTQLLTDKQKLSELIAARGQLLNQLALDEAAEQQALVRAQEERREATQYLLQLRAQLPAFPEEGITDLSEPVIPETSVLEWPLTGEIRITAGFKDPAYEKSFDREHDGLDLFAPQGTPIIAPANGTVEKTADNGLGYSYVILSHNDGLYTVYGHVSEILVAVGDVISLGQEIAKTGGTPGTPGAGFFTTGPHLHFEVFRDGQFFDPLDFLPPL